MLEATNGHEALDRLRSSPVPVVVVLDTIMPESDGLEFLGAVQADATLLANRHCYMVVTAVPLDRLVLPHDLSGLLVVPPIRKPFDLADFLQALAQAAAKLPTSQSGSGAPPSEGSRTSARPHSPRRWENWAMTAPPR